MDCVIFFIEKENQEANDYCVGEDGNLISNLMSELCNVDNKVIVTPKIFNNDDNYINNNNNYINNNNNYICSPYLSIKLSRMKKSQLKYICERANIHIESNYKKKKLIELLESEINLVHYISDIINTPSEMG
jgi:hypothetical protein